MIYVVHTCIKLQLYPCQLYNLKTMRILPNTIQQKKNRLRENLCTKIALWDNLVSLWRKYCLIHLQKSVWSRGIISNGFQWKKVFFRLNLIYNGVLRHDHSTGERGSYPYAGLPMGGWNLKNLKKMFPHPP